MAFVINPITGELDFVSDASASGVEWQDIENKPSTFTPANHGNEKHSATFVNVSELATVSGALHSEITALDFYTPAEVDTISGALSSADTSNYNTLDSKINTTSGSLQSEIDALQASAAGLIYYMVDVDSDISGYEVAGTSPGGNPEDTDAIVVNSSSGEVLIGAYATASGTPGTTVIPGGLWDFSIFASVDSGTGVSQIVARVYKRASNGTETQLFSGTTAEINNTTVAEVVIRSFQPDITLLASDRLVIKFFAKTTSGPNRTLTYYYEGTTNYTHVSTPVQVLVLSDHGSLEGLGDDDHLQYHTDARGDVRYYTKSQVDTISGSISNSVPSSTDYPSGVATISGSSDTVSIVFEEELADASYEVVCSMENTTDLTPSTFTYFVNAKSATGFTVKLSGNTDTSNYKLNWRTGAVAVIGENGVVDHSLLTKLAFEDSGHTGFSASAHVHDYADAADLAALSGSIDLALAGKSDTTHNHDSDYLSLDGGTITQNLIILGDLSVSGTQYTTNQETLAIESNYIVVNDGEVGAGVSAGDAGLQVDRGSENDYFFAFDESTDTFRVGVSGSLQPVATREDSPTNLYIPVWLSATNSFSTASGLAKSSVMTSLSVDANPTLGGNLVLDGYCINYGAPLSTNGLYRGEIMTVQVDDSNAAYGKVLYQGTDFNYDLADADAVATSPSCVIALESGTGSKKVLIKGMICSTAWNWSAGKMYLSGTAGSMTQTKPSTTGQQIQVLGWALRADAIFFDPVLMVAEVA